MFEYESDENVKVEVCWEKCRKERLVDYNVPPAPPYSLACGASNSAADTGRSDRSGGWPRARPLPRPERFDTEEKAHYKPNMKQIRFKPLAALDLPDSSSDNSTVKGTLIRTE